jgi:hypothetical protein
MGILFVHDVFHLVGPSYQSLWTKNQHTLNLLAIFDEDKTAKERVGTILCTQTLTDLPDENYQVATVEAALLANYREADQMVLEMVALLLGKSGTLWRLYPVAILGTLRAGLAASRTSHYTAKYNEKFLDMVNAELGTMFRDYGNVAPDGRGDQASDWILGELSRALSDYLFGLDETKIARAKGIVSGLQGSERIGESAAKMFAELNHRLFYALGAAGQISALRKELCAG